MDLEPEISYHYPNLTSVSQVIELYEIISNIK